MLERVPEDNGEQRQPGIATMNMCEAIRHAFSQQTQHRA
jgi:hypothetical protein